MKKLLLLLLLAVPYSLMAQQHYKIYSTAQRKLIAVDEIIEQMQNVDVLFFGEEHNDTVGHRAELNILQKLIARYPNRVALSMEMFETDCQPVLNEYLQGLITEKFLTADARAWPNYATDYRPLVELAKANRLPVIAANAPGRYVNFVNRNGITMLQQLGTQAKSYLPPLPVDTLSGPYYEKFAQLMGGHGSMGGMQLYQAQNLWDATMGWSIAGFWSHHKDFKILQVNGGFHSEEKLGTAAQLRHYAPGIRIINISAYAGSNFAKPDWNAYAKTGDYIIITDFKGDDN